MTIPLTRGQVAKVSKKDFARLSKFNWHLTGDGVCRNFYAARWIRVGAQHEVVVVRTLRFENGAADGRRQSSHSSPRRAGHASLITRRQ